MIVNMYLNVDKDKKSKIKIKDGKTTKETIFTPFETKRLLNVVNDIMNTRKLVK